MDLTSCSKLLTAAATVATSAFLASTVAIETAKAATFTLKDEIAEQFAEQWLLSAPNAESVEELFAEVATFGDLVESEGEWEAWYGQVKLPFLGEEGNYSLFYYDVGKIYGLLDGYRGDIYLGDVEFPKAFKTSADMWTVVGRPPQKSVPEPSSAIALVGVLGAGLVASRLRRRSK